MPGAIASSRDTSVPCLFPCAHFLAGTWADIKAGGFRGGYRALVPEGQRTRRAQKGHVRAPISPRRDPRYAATAQKTLKDPPKDPL